MEQTYVVHYSEVALKGKNRPEFARTLARNVSSALFGLDASVRQGDSRVFVQTGAEEGEVLRRLSKVFGVSWLAKASSVPSEYPAISMEVLSQARSLSGPTFRITARRSDKSFAMRSKEVEERLGSEVVAATGKSVSLGHPDVNMHVDLLKGRALVYSNRVQGPGGLPVGTAGRVIHLFSGGIDSPVAAWLLMKRGCRPVYLHFFAAPYPEAPLEGKVGKLVKILSQSGGRCTLLLVPFDEYQLATLGKATGSLEPSLFRRFMRMSGELLAPAFGASALSTGDSLSQAASQTIWNIRTFDEGCALPILRPLLTYDKEEIVNLAKSIGTYDASLEEYKDCCSIVSSHPKTRAKGAEVSELASRLGFAELARKSFSQGVLVAYDPSKGKTKVAPLGEVLRRAALELSAREAVPAREKAHESIEPL